MVSREVYFNTEAIVLWFLFFGGFGGRGLGLVVGCGGHYGDVALSRRHDDEEVVREC